VALLTVEATTADELDIAFASAAAQHADAVMDLGDPLTFTEAPRIIALAANEFRFDAGPAGSLPYPLAVANPRIRACSPTSSRPALSSARSHHPNQLHADARAGRIPRANCA
jgi:hypothetical protein